MKRCTKCGVSKPQTEFYAAKGGKDGLRGDCKECFAGRARDWYSRNRGKAIENAKRWRQENLERAQATRRARYAVTRERAQEQHLTRTFGMSLVDYDRMLAAQGGVCAICRHSPRPGERFHVDHHDERGGVRGILCVRCNNALGQFLEDVDIAQRAVDYLDANGFVPAGTYELQEAAVDRTRELILMRGAA